MHFLKALLKGGNGIIGDGGLTVITLLESISIYNKGIKENEVKKGVWLTFYGNEDLQMVVPMLLQFNQSVIDRFIFSFS